MARTLKPLTDDNCCVTCGSDDIRLAEDQTRYSVLEWDTFGTPQAVYSDTQGQDGRDSVRCFCNDSGQYHHIPEGLTK